MSGTTDTWIVQEISDLDAVRSRPQLYVGTTDGNGISTLALFALQCSLGDEGPLAGHAKSATVIVLLDGGIRVEDSGQGFPLGLTSQGIPWLIEAFRGLIMGPDSSSALSIVKALSRRVVATTRRNGEIWRVEFDGDDPVAGPECLGRTDEIGSTVEFWPSKDVFTGSTDIATITTRLRTFLKRYPGTVVTVRDERSGVPDAVVDSEP